MTDTLFFLLTLLSFIGFIIGLIKPEKVIRWGEKKTRKQVTLVYGVATILFFILFAIVIPPTEKTSPINLSPASTVQKETESKDIQKPSEIEKQPEKETKIDLQTYPTVIDKIETYKLPVKSGAWQTCVIESINALNNVQLILFQEWLYSLSPYASEETNLIAIARKLGCPEPTITIIPAKIEVIKSWEGIGSKNLGSFTPNTAEWIMKISWQNSPFNEDFGDDEFAIERRMLFDYGIVDYEEGASITSSPLISAFYTPSGSEERDSSYLGYKHFDILRVKAPEQATWKIEIYKIIEPEQRFIE